MHFLSIKKVQNFKTTFINLNYKKNNYIEFLNNVKSKIEILLINFKKITYFCDIPKQNKGLANNLRQNNRYKQKINCEHHEN